MGKVLLGLLLLALMIPSAMLINRVNQPIEQENIPMQSPDNDAVKWEAEENSLVTTWNENYPTEKTVDGTTYEKWDVLTESDIVYPVAPWIANILQLAVPLVLFMGAVISFMSVARYTRSYKHYKSRIKNTVKTVKTHFSMIHADNVGEFRPTDGLILLVNTLIGTVFLVKLLPLIWDWATSIEGMWGLGILITLIPIATVVGYLYGVIKYVTQ